MAKEATQPSALATAAAKARAVLSAAKDKASSPPTDAQKKEIDRLAAIAKDANAKENRERFQKVADGRYKKAVKAIRQMAAVCNAKTYTFLHSELDALHLGLSTELASVKTAYDKAKTGDAKSAADDIVSPIKAG